MAVALTLGGGGDPTVRSLTLGYAALVTGLVMELLRLTGSPATVAAMSLVALVLSLFAFLPFKHEAAYSVRGHLDTWPLVFAGALLVLAMGSLRKQLVLRLDEGTTLLHSIVFLYWMMDAFAHGSGHAIWIVAATVLLVLAALHAWTDLPLSRPVRLAMSLWNSIVLLALAIWTALGLVRAGSVEDFVAVRDLGGGAMTWVAYFVFGTASAYIATNLTMLAGYLPAPGSFFNPAYFRAVRELNNQHVARLSPGQVDPRQATAVAAGVCIFFTAHWFLRPFPTRVALWFVLTAVPWTLQAWAAWRSRAERGVSPAGPNGSLRRPS